MMISRRQILRITRVGGLAAALLVGAATANAQAPGTTVGPNLGPLVSAPVQKPAQDPPKDAEPRDQLIFLMSGYEYFPTKDDLAKVGSDAEVSTLLRGLASDTKMRPSIRTRAVDALAYYGDEASVAFLESIIENGSVPADRAEARIRDSFRHHGMMSLAKSQKERALPTLERMLVHDDIQLRMTAISAIGKHAGADGKERLERLSATEEHPVVKRELRKYLAH